MNAVLSVKDLAYEDRGAPILKKVNVSLAPGALLIICGSSGHGKTTFLRLLMGLEQPKAGKIVLFDHDIRTLSETEFNKLRSKVGFVFQNSALLSMMTVEENLRLPLVYHKLSNDEEIEKRVESTLEMLLIKEYRHAYPAELSVGLQKRTAMARAIITRPNLILMDEPTAGLDAISRSLLLALIENIRMVRDVPMLMVTNDLMAARSMRAPIGVLKDGEMLKPMLYDELSKYKDGFVKSLLAGMQV